MLSHYLIATPNAHTFTLYSARRHGLYRLLTRPFLDFFIGRSGLRDYAGPWTYTCRPYSIASFPRSSRFFNVVPPFPACTLENREETGDEAIYSTGHNVIE